MKISQQEFNVNGTTYIIRSAVNKDTKNLSETRLQIDGETENLNRENQNLAMQLDAFQKYGVDEVFSG